MLKETPPETEEERQNCETMRETIKGMFLTQRRSKTEVAFITENIDRYEELFEVCMNGDDAQFKKGITELQKAQKSNCLTPSDFDSINLSREEIDDIFD